ncbi:MAG: hypothetical protein J0L87_08030 [Bacteroidetes bacterium]|nr:hypothetical protein [Bacteroidota bacterium]
MSLSDFKPILNTDLIALVGIILTFIVSALSLYIGIINSQKSIFINSVTASRTKWIDTVRNSISEYCGLARQYILSRDLTDEKEQELSEKIDKLKYLIKLQLNPIDPFDKKIIGKIDYISSFTFKDEQELEKEINELIAMTQDYLKLEWEGVKEESKRGNLSKRRKMILYEKYLKTKKES